MSQRSEDGCAAVIVGAAVAVILAVTLGWNWYRAGVQADTYHRQGIQLTQWECFIGTKPAEQAITIKTVEVQKK